MTKERKISKLMLKVLRKYGYIETAPSCRLIKGTYSVNPGHALPCIPHCRIDSPTLLLRHHAVQGLELWHCRSCHRNILIKIDRRQVTAFD
jgi:hypothetical protein